MKESLLGMKLIVAACAALAGCLEASEEELGTASQEVSVIQDGIECYVATPAQDVFTWTNCNGSWPGGPSSSTATFRVGTRILSLLGDGSSPNFAWSDSRCSSNPYLDCTLPIKRGQPLSIRVLLTSPVDGTLTWDSRARAFYY
jgi:hypothetical protein